LQIATDHADALWRQALDAGACSSRVTASSPMRALDDAVRAGKILYIGISDTPAWVVSRANTLAEWRGWTPLAGLHVPYSLLNRDIERELLPMASRRG
jgi:aryl-alcohol dehydrogenase-like predicted oxidoreductase